MAPRTITPIYPETQSTSGIYPRSYLIETHPQDMELKRIAVDESNTLTITVTTGPKQDVAATKARVEGLLSHAKETDNMLAHLAWEQVSSLRNRDVTYKITHANDDPIRNIALALSKNAPKSHGAHDFAVLDEETCKALITSDISHMVEMVTGKAPARFGRTPITSKT